MVQPTVSWHREEYEALGVPFERRGELLDEHLAAWRALWRPTPASFDGRHYRFSDVYLEPKPFRPEGRSTVVRGHERRAVDRAPAGRSTATAFIRSASPPWRNAGRWSRRWRRPGATCPSSRWSAASGATSRAGRRRRPGPRPPRRSRAAGGGYTTICFKPSQYTDDPAEVGGLCRRLVASALGLNARVRSQTVFTSQ